MLSFFKMSRISCVFLIAIVFAFSGIHSFSFLSPQTFADTVVTASGNPYRTGFSAENATRVDAIVARILLRGKDLPRENYISYLALVDKGIVSLSERPAYSGNTEVKNVVGFISYEINRTRKGLMDGTVIADDVMRIADEAYQASLTAKIAPSTSAPTIAPAATPTTRPTIIMTNLDWFRKSSFFIYSTDKSPTGTSVTFSYNIPDNFACQSQDPAVGILPSSQQIRGKGTYDKAFTATVQETLYCVGSDGKWGSRTLEVAVSPGAAGISLSVSELVPNANGGYPSVAPGTKLTIGYNVMSSQWCWGTLTKVGAAIGTRVQFITTTKEGNTTTQITSQKTKLTSGYFEITVNDSSQLDFSCYGFDNKETVKSMSFQVK